MSHGDVRLLLRYNPTPAAYGLFSLHSINPPPPHLPVACRPVFLLFPLFMRCVVWWLTCSLFFFTACLSLAIPASAQITVTPKQPRVLLLLDGSASMQQPWSGEGSAPRFATAARIIERLMDSVYSVNPNVEFGLRVYGHQYGSAENNCYDTRREVLFSKNNRTQMALRLANLRPQGVSPIAYSIRRAAQDDLEDGLNHSYAVILVTDGGESCSGDICAAVQEFLRQKVFFKPYIIGLAPVEGLRAQYECLGQYLQVTKEGEMPSAIGTIVEDYRRALTVALKEDKALPTAAVVPPPPRVDPKPIVIEVPAPQREVPYELSLLATRPSVRSFPIRYTTALYPARMLPNIVLKPTVAEPEPVVTYTLFFLTPVRARALFPQRIGAPSYRPRTAPRIAPPAPEPMEPEPPVAYLRTVPTRTAVIVRSYARASGRTFNPQKFALPKFEPDPAPVVAVTAAPPKPAPPTVRDTPKPAPKPTPALPKPTAPPVASSRPATPVAGGPTPKVAEATVTSIPDAESGLEIYFTDGKGTFYPSTPQMLLLDAKTGVTAQKFYRLLNPAGKPELQKATPGRYDVLVAGRANLIVRGVNVEAGKRTRVDIKVSNGSLKFGYANDRKRPITEFEALVNRRFAPGPVIRQRCTAELEYEPGNYYIEVNTTPISRHNIDLEFGVQMEILIPEPGWVQFTNTSPVGFVALYHQLGDRFVRFAAMTVDGRPDVQKMRLQPGAYEAHWVPNPNVPYAKETVQSFFVKADKTTDVELKSGSSRP